MSLYVGRPVENYDTYPETRSTGKEHQLLKVLGMAHATAHYSVYSIVQAEYCKTCNSSVPIRTQGADPRIVQ